MLPESAGNSNNSANPNKKGGDVDIFPGFKPAVEACLLDWSDYPLNGITYSAAASHYYCPVMCCRHDAAEESLKVVSFFFIILFKKKYI